MRDHNKQRVWLDLKPGLGIWLMGLAALTMVLLWAVGDRATSLLEYDRVAIFHGEYWRLVTGHLVHAGFRHMALNLAGGAIMAALFTRTYSVLNWIVIILVSLLAIDLGFIFRDRDLATYVGFSGILHGILAAGAIAWWRTESRGLALALSTITAGKLAWEQWQGPVTLAGDELRVIVNAHLYGAIGGGLAGLVLVIFAQVPRRKMRSRPSTV